MTRRRWRRADTGAAAVEFALIAPFLLLLLFGIISYGYMLSFRQAISQAAAEAARAAALTSQVGNRTSVATAIVDEALESYQGVDCAGAGLACNITVDPCPVDGSPAFLRVGLDYDYDAEPLTPPMPGFGMVMPDHLVYEAVVEVSC